MNPVDIARSLFKNAKNFKKNKALEKRKIKYNAYRTGMYSKPEVTYTGQSCFSIVAAVYGVEKYLDKFISSVVKQTLDFEQYIQLILVDDGSIDNSADICNTWAKKYPDNIVVVSKENGGQASARNLGLEYVKHEWVIFCDPDDFLQENYFYNTSLFLDKADSDIALISTNVKVFYENRVSYKNSHPLRNKYNNGSYLEKISIDSDFMQLFVNSAIFKTEYIEGLKFEDIKPVFEDVLFVNTFLLSNFDKYIAVIPESEYFYRKRADESSAIDTVWEYSEKYNEVFTLGHHELVSISLKKHNEIPKFIKLILIYDTHWYFRRFCINPIRQTELTNEQSENLKLHLNSLFANITEEDIRALNVPGFNTFWKNSVVLLMKKEASPIENGYIWDFDKKENLVSFFYHGSSLNEDIKYYYGDKEVTPKYRSIVKKEFFGETQVIEYRDRVEINEAFRLSVVCNGEPITIEKYKQLSLKNMANLFKNKNMVRGGRISSLYKKIANTSYFKNKYKDCWLLMDRDNQADDNAEHLYRYMQKNNVKENYFFVLRKGCHDWKRLKDDGFNLIEFGSLEHIIATINAIHIVSSHADHYISDFLNRKNFKDVLKFKFTFLQHGVIKDDLSVWLNSKNIRHFICTSQGEYNSIVNGNYRFSDYEVALTGLPRHDKLLKINKTENKKIVIMPTWRAGLVGKSLGKTTEREVNDEFYQSDYYRQWYSFLNSERLSQIVNEYGYEILFFPHTLVQNYFKASDFPNIKLLFNDDVDSIQTLFAEVDLLITDYSSVTFEVGYLSKPTIYYQFDREYVFGSGHTYQKGYFSYDDHGFGPVCFDENELIEQLFSYVKDDCVVPATYQQRMDSFFPFKDGKCCERVYKLIEGS